MRYKTHRHHRFILRLARFAPDGNESPVDSNISARVCRSKNARCFVHSGAICAQVNARDRECTGLESPRRVIESETESSSPIQTLLVKKARDRFLAASAIDRFADQR